VKRWRDGALGGWTHEYHAVVVSHTKALVVLANGLRFRRRERHYLAVGDPSLSMTRKEQERPGPPGVSPHFKESR